MPSNNNITPGKVSSDAIDLENEIHGISQKQKNQNRIKLTSAKGKNRKTHLVINIAALSLCAYGFFMLKNHVTDNNASISSPTMTVVSFSDVNQCANFAAVNADFKSIDCIKLSAQASEKSEQTGGAWMMLNGEKGKACYNIDTPNGFSVVKQKKGDKAFSIPLYYVKHVDLSKSGLYYPSGHQAQLNFSESKTMQNIAIYNKRADICG